MPLLKTETYINSDGVLAHLDEAEIWYAYYGPFEIGQIYSSVFREDKHPSCGFYINKNGKIIYNDISTSEKLDCFAFVGKRFGLPYGQAVRQVACDFGIIDCGTKKFSKGMLSQAQIAANHIKKETDIEIVPEKWNNTNLAFWKKLFITEQELKAEDVYCVKKLFINGKLVPNYNKEIRYAYVLNAKGKSYKKIYTPYANKSNFKWISNIPLHIPFGITKLSYSTRTLMIAKANKDRLLFKKFLPDVIALQNESPSALNDKTRKHISTNYDLVYIALDPDAAGMAATEHYVSCGYHPLFIPEKAQGKGLKDFADFVEMYGLGWFEKYLKIKEII